MRVLVIEDEPDLLRVLTRALREEGYAVGEARDGEEGFFKATSGEYDALVLDLMLPRLDGWEVLQRLRRTHKTPVLILTARDGVEDRVRRLNEEADDYLVKPFELTELVARLRALIRRLRHPRRGAVARLRAFLPGGPGPLPRAAAAAWGWPSARASSRPTAAPSVSPAL